MQASVEPVSGGLESMPLWDLVPKLADKRASGVLKVSRGAQRRTFELVGGAVVRSSSADPREYLGQYLVDFGLVSSRAAAQAFRSQEETQVLLGKILPANGALDEDRVRAALVSKINEGLLDSYRWEHGEVEFVPGEPDAGQGVKVRVSLADLHREALHRAKLWKDYLKLFPSPDAILRLGKGESDKPHAIQPDEQVLLNLAREGQPVSAALAAFREGEFQVYRRLAGMVAKGRLLPAELDPWATKARETDGKSLVEAAKVMLRSGRASEAATLAARACEQAPSSVALQVLRDAQQALVLKLTDDLLRIEGRPYVRARSEQLAALKLQPAEHYLLMRVDSGADLRAVIKAAPMGELEALRILNRLVQASLIGFRRN